MHTLHILPPLERIQLSALAHVRAPAMVRLAEGHEPHGQLRHLWTDNLPPDQLAAEGLTEPCPAVDVAAVPDVEVRSDWMPHRPDGVLGEHPVYPAYVGEFYESGGIDAFGYPVVVRRRRVSRPAYVVTHFNMRTYGHFLLEVLPKLLVIERLYALGQRWPVVFPASMRPLRAIVRAACPRLELLIYDDRRETLALPLALLPTLTLSGSGHLHDVSLAMLRLLALRLGLGARPGRRLFLVRDSWPSFRVLDNEAELRAVAVRYGFEPIRPERLPWGEQVALFASASHVIGEFTSALHNTLFCQPAAKVVCLNRMSGLQSAIASSAGHEIGYLLPEGGVSTLFRPNWTEPQHFTINAAELAARLEQIGLTAI